MRPCSKGSSRFPLAAGFHTSRAITGTPCARRNYPKIADVCQTDPALAEHYLQHGLQEHRVPQRLRVVATYVAAAGLDTNVVFGGLCNQIYSHVTMLALALQLGAEVVRCVALVQGPGLSRSALPCPMVTGIAFAVNVEPAMHPGCTKMVSGPSAWTNKDLPLHCVSSTVKLESWPETGMLLAGRCGSGAHVSCSYWPVLQFSDNWTPQSCLVPLDLC